MQFKDFLIAQFKAHPSATPQDAVKQCYQAAFGAEHLLTDFERASAYFYDEYASLEACEGILAEPISPDVCRVNMAAWKHSGMPAEWLLRLFAQSASAPADGSAAFDGFLIDADETVRDGAAPFTPDEWREYIERYRTEGVHAVHHSPEYRAAERPAYRIVRREVLSVLPILKTAARLSPQSGARVIALDGRAASGKTTLANTLSAVLDAPVVHMDDFFLPRELRTQARLSQPGGNVHYERFVQEVLPYIARPEAFEYRVFDCGKMDFGGTRTVAQGSWRIVEGSYSCHPAFGDYADLRAFLSVSPEEQLRRITLRNGARMAEVFAARWIPMEEKYFDACRIREAADVTIDTGR